MEISPARSYICFLDSDSAASSPNRAPLRPDIQAAPGYTDPARAVKTESEPVEDSAAQQAEAGFSGASPCSPVPPDYWEGVWKLGNDLEGYEKTPSPSPAPGNSPAFYRDDDFTTPAAGPAPSHPTRFATSRPDCSAPVLTTPSPSSSPSPSPTSKREQKRQATAAKMSAQATATAVKDAARAQLLRTKHEAKSALLWQAHEFKTALLEQRATQELAYAEARGRQSAERKTRQSRQARDKTARAPRASAGQRAGRGGASTSGSHARGDAGVGDITPMFVFRNSLNCRTYNTSQETSFFTKRLVPDMNDLTMNKWRRNGRYMDGNGKHVCLQCRCSCFTVIFRLVVKECGSGDNGQPVTQVTADCLCDQSACQAAHNVIVL